MYSAVLTLTLFLPDTKPAKSLKKPQKIEVKKGSLMDSLASRFELANPDRFTDSSKIRNWLEGRPIPSPGDFLSRLWAHFGKPMAIGYEGFSYLIHDKRTDLIFEAYSGASGPSFGGSRHDVKALEPVLLQFEQLLALTQPVDCEVEYETDFGLYESGCKGGVPFDREKSKADH
jgi:hypothetical protein